MMSYSIDTLYNDALGLLQSLIGIQSYSGEEDKTADIIAAFLNQRGIQTQRLHNNIYCYNKHYNPTLPTIVLNSHHDTVKIGEGWTQDPLGGVIINDHIYGRGSNDAGGALVSLIVTFVHFYNQKLNYNLLLIASGEEENFGNNGVSAVLSQLESKPALGIIGEPTEMQLGVAEKGLIVIDANTQGVAGHAARDTGTNALYLATEDINKIATHDWKKVSSVLGRTKTTVTQINAGTQHNVIPDKCSYVIDCRVNEHYTLQEVVDDLNAITHAELRPRSLKWHPSGIQLDHAIVKKATSIGRTSFGSPTLSDQVHFQCPTVKIGPGVSERSHTIDEYLLTSELEEGIKIYIQLLTDLTI